MTYRPIRPILMFNFLKKKHFIYFVQKKVIAYQLIRCLYIRITFNLSFFSLEISRGPTNNKSTSDSGQEFVVLLFFFFPHDLSIQFYLHSRTSKFNLTRVALHTIDLRRYRVKFSNFFSIVAERYGCRFKLNFFFSHSNVIKIYQKEFLWVVTKKNKKNKKNRFQRFELEFPGTFIRLPGTN